MSYPFNNYHRRTRRHEPPRFITRAQEEHRQREHEQARRREAQDNNDRIDRERLAEWNALTQQERNAAIEATGNPHPPLCELTPWQRKSAEQDLIDARIRYARRARLTAQQRQDQDDLAAAVAAANQREAADRADTDRRRREARDDPFSTFGT